jgi:hypothetical protein
MEKSAMRFMRQEVNQRASFAKLRVQSHATTSGQNARRESAAKPWSGNQANSVCIIALRGRTGASKLCDHLRRGRSVPIEARRLTLSAMIRIYLRPHSRRSCFEKQNSPVAISATGLFVVGFLRWDYACLRRRRPASIARPPRRSAALPGSGTTNVTVGSLPLPPT